MPGRTDSKRSQYSQSSNVIGFVLRLSAPVFYRGPSLTVLTGLSKSSCDRMAVAKVYKPETIPIALAHALTHR